MVTRLPKVLDRIGDRSDLIIILGGTNDFNKLDCVKRVNVAHEILTLHRIVHKRGLRSVLVTIPECSMLNKKCDDNRQKVNDKLRSYAAKNKKNTLLCDLGKFMPLRNMSDFDRKVYWDDKVHPSRIGYDKIAALLFHTIRAWLMPPVMNITIPPSDSDDDDIKDKKGKRVPDPDPVTKLNGHQKKISHKKKENRDKKLAQALVSDINPKVAKDTKSSNYEAASGVAGTAGAAGPATQFSPFNTQAITALPSVSSAGTSSTKAAELALEVTEPKKSATEKVSTGSKVTLKTNPKHNNKKAIHDALNKKMNDSVKSNALKNSPNRQSSTNANSFAPKTSSTNSPAPLKLEAEKPASQPASTNVNANPPAQQQAPSQQTYNTPPSTNTTGQYTQEIKNETNAPNNTTPQNATPPQQLQQQEMMNAAADQAQTYEHNNNVANINNANINHNDNSSETPNNSDINIENGDTSNNNSSDPYNQYNNNTNNNNNNNNMAANSQDVSMPNQQQNTASSMLPVDKLANQPSAPVAPPPTATAGAPANVPISPNVKSASQPDLNAQNNPASTGTQGDIGDLQRNFPEFNLHEKRHN